VAFAVGVLTVIVYSRDCLAGMIDVLYNLT